MRPSVLATIALAASLAAAPAMAQSGTAASNAGLPPECDILGPALDQATIDRIQDLGERRQALSCMVGTPRDYQAELSSRPEGGAVNSVDLEQSWGADVVAEGLEQSAEANAAATGDLQTALSSDAEISGYMQQSDIDATDIIGYIIGPNGTTTLILAPSMSDQTATGSTSGDSMQSDDAMASDDGADDAEAGASQ